MLRRNYFDKGVHYDRASKLQASNAWSISTHASSSKWEGKIDGLPLGELSSAERRHFDKDVGSS